MLNFFQAVDISRVEYEPSDLDILYADGIMSSNGLACAEFIFPHAASEGSCDDDVSQQDTLARWAISSQSYMQHVKLQSLMKIAFVRFSGGLAVIGSIFLWD